MLATLLVRQRVAEIMDDPHLDPGLHADALKGLERLNTIGNSKKIIAAKIENLAKKIGAGKNVSIKVLDLACGGGDLPAALASYLSARNVDVEILGLDVSETAIEYARSKNYKNCKFSRLDVINDELPEGYDVIITSLFTHHLDPPQIRALLAKMATKARHLVLVNDLERSLFSLWGVTLASQIVTTSHVVHHDGPASVRAAFTAAEMLQMAHDVGLNQASVTRQFPCRILLTVQTDTNHRQPEAKR